MFKMQLASKIYAIKKDLFYIAQNCQIALDKESLSYLEYKINEDKMEQVVKELLLKNYNSDVKLEYVKYNFSNNTIEICVNAFVVPILNINSIKKVSVPITCSYKLKMMEVN